MEKYSVKYLPYFGLVNTSSDAYLLFSNQIPFTPELFKKLYDDMPSPVITSNVVYKRPGTLHMRLCQSVVSINESSVDMSSVIGYNKSDIFNAILSLSKSSGISLDYSLLRPMGEIKDDTFPIYIPPEIPLPGFGTMYLSREGKETFMSPYTNSLGMDEEDRKAISATMSIENPELSRLVFWATISMNKPYYIWVYKCLLSKLGM